jgi:hypothetical protein
MKITTQSADQFEITDYPWLKTILYVATMALFVGVTIEKYRANLPKEAAAVAVLVAFMVLFFPSMCAFAKLVFDRAASRIVYSRLTLRGWHSKEWRFDELSSVSAATDPNEKVHAEPHFRMELSWNSGAPPLAMPISYQGRAKGVSVGGIEKTVQALQIWLYGKKIEIDHRSDDNDEVAEDKSGEQRQ